MVLEEPDQKVAIALITIFLKNLLLVSVEIIISFSDPLANHICKAMFLLDFLFWPDICVSILTI